jgi:adenylate cyclase
LTNSSTRTGSTYAGTTPRFFRGKCDCDRSLGTVFLVDGEADVVCDRALAAAEAAVAASRTLDREFAREGRAPLRFGLALHLGEVEFGNIGTHDRLDFTAIGPAVNHATRLEALTKELRTPVLVSAAFAGGVPRPMRRLGRFVLRGMVGEVEVDVP